MLPPVLSAERTEDKAIEEDAKKGIVRARKGVQQNLNAAEIPFLALRAEKAAHPAEPAAPNQLAPRFSSASFIRKYTSAGSAVRVTPGRASLQYLWRR
jgi:hypothetical protein